MKSKVVWSPQVENYVHSNAPEPRTALWKEIKKLVDWDGRENPPHIRHLEDELSGYSCVRIKRERVIFREAFENGQRVIKCLFAGPRKTIYEAFQELLLDEMAS